MTNKTKFHLSEVIIFSFFILLSLIATFPLIFRMCTHIYGGGDSFSTVWGFWWYKYAGINHVSSSLCPLLAAPFGLDFSQLPFSLFAQRIFPLLTLPFNEIFAYNFYVLISFPLSAITMYYLVRHFTKNSWASMFAGIIYGFCPYHFVHAPQHLSLASIQWMPLYVLSLFKLTEERSYRSALFCALAFSLVFLSDYYYGYFITIFTATFVVWGMWYGWKNRGLSGYPVSRLAGEKKDRSPITDHRSPFKTIRVVLVAVVVALAIILPATRHILKPVFSPKTEAVTSLGYERSFSGLFTYSAHLFHYLIPSGDNPFIGGFTRNFIKVYHPIEQTLYLGWVGIVLSIVAVREWRRQSKLVNKLTSRQVNKSKRNQKAGDKNWQTGKLANWSTRTQKAVSFFLFAGIVALLFSHAAWTDIGPFRIFFPSYFMYKIAPMFRIYARFGILVMLSVSILAGIGLADILRYWNFNKQKTGQAKRAVILQKIKSSKKQRILVAVITLLVFVEFAPILPTPMVNAVDPPPVYEWLAEQPGDFTIAEYPLESDSEYLFWQRIHKKRLVNGALPGTYADEIRKEIADILKPDTPGILKYLGVKYVIFHSGKYAKSAEIEIIGQVPDIKGESGLKLVRTFSGVRVYEVIAKPIQPR